MTENEMLTELEQTMSEIREIKSGLASAMTKLNAIQGNLKSDKKEREKKAYEFGHDAGESYGIAKAMWALKKLFECESDREWRAMGFKCDKDDWMENFEYILYHHDPEEIVKKVTDYETEKNEIHVGDEVRAEDGTAVFVVTWMSENCICGVDREGKCYSYEPREVCGKTGRRYDIVFSDIARGEDNED